jgi:hypothetical protein
MMEFFVSNDSEDDLLSHSCTYISCGIEILVEFKRFKSKLVPDLWDLWLILTFLVSYTAI